VTCASASVCSGDRTRPRARNRYQAARARHDIELGGLVVKAGIVDLTNDDRATILGALIWMADKLKGGQGEQARALWVAKGEQAFEAESAPHDQTGPALRR
jgi:hypothetical protein